MFLNCNKIIEIDCSHFNCSQVTSCSKMFKQTLILKIFHHLILCFMDVKI